MNNFPPEPMLAKTCAELRCILNAWSHDWTTEFRQAINELTRRAEDRDLARAGIGSLHKSYVEAVDERDEARTSYAAEVQWASNLKKQLDAVNEKHAEACRVLRNFQAGFEERGKNLLAIAQGLGITYLADYAPEVAGPQEALLRAIDDLRNRADTAEANYAKARDIALRKKERDNDLDQAQVNDAQDATWRWSYETSAKANPGSSMAKVIEAGDEMQRVLLRNFDIVNRANERLTGKMKAIEAGAVITGPHVVDKGTIEILTKQRDDARGIVDQWCAETYLQCDRANAAEKERDEARAALAVANKECDRLDAECNRAGKWLDEARAEIERLTKERDEARAELAASAAVLQATKGLISFYTPICTHCGWRGSGETTEEASHRQLTTHIEACPKLRERENAAVVAELRIGLANLDSLLAVPPWDVRSTWRADAFEDVRRSLQRRIAELTPKPEGETP